MPETGQDDRSSSQPRPLWFRFSLKSLLIAMALVAVYFGGRASMRPNWFAPQAGTWRLIMTSGHQRPVTLSALPDGRFLLDRGSSSNLGGQYRWKAGKLVVEVPNDKRYVGLIWQWDGDDLVLVAEPPGTPAGPSYLGARLQFVSSDISAATQKSVPVVPSRIAVQQAQQAKERGGVVPQFQARLPGFQPAPWHDPAPGEWTLIFPRGATRLVKLSKLPDGKFELATGGVLNGTYQVQNEQLEVVAPGDPRMKGLAWAWQNDELVLISEPSPPPTGSRYLGARMKKVVEEQRVKGQP